MNFDFNRILFVNSYACNMNCPYCMHYEHKRNAKIKPNMQFGLDNSKAFFDFFLDNSPYDTIQITFSGGEPLFFFDSYMKPFILYMREQEKVKNKHIIIDMFTNGTLLNEERILFFKEHYVKIGISYDGHCGQQYRDAKTLETVESKIKLCNTLAPEILSVASTFYSDTIGLIYDSYQTMLDMGIKYWSFAIDTLTNGYRYPLEKIELLGDQIYKIWTDSQDKDIDIMTFNKIKGFKDYADSNKCLIARPDGEICIGTTVPVLIPDTLFPLFSVGYWQVDEEKLAKYQEVMGDFHVHVMGKNYPEFCEVCKVKSCCQDVEITPAEAYVRSSVDSMHCLENLIISRVMDGEWE